MARATLGIVVGNRDFFPDSLISTGSGAVLDVLARLDIEPVILDEHTTKLGAVETLSDARRCAELFAKNRDRIDGVLVTLPNFGDEKGLADTLKLARLDVPVLLHAFPDELDKLDVARRRDGFCGKISAANNLRQAGIKFSLTSRHVMPPSSRAFCEDLMQFVGVCKVVKGMKSARIGAIGSRPAAFNTVRFSEKILEANGISVVTADLSDVFASAGRLGDSDAQVLDMLEKIRNYLPAPNVPDASLRKMAKLGLAISHWAEANQLDATAIQCWTSIQQNFGINACALMSMMSQQLMPSACEVDVTGAAAMYALTLASAAPSALVDWNNNYGDENDTCVLFHCGNWAKCFIPSGKISTAPILGSTVGVERTWGALEGRTPAGPFTFARLTTDDTRGAIKAYVGEGELTDQPLDTFGSRAVAKIPDLEGLMRYVCWEGFEHHVAISMSRVANVLAEAFEGYLGWETYFHRPQ